MGLYAVVNPFDKYNLLYLTDQEYKIQVRVALSHGSPLEVVASANTTKEIGNGSIPPVELPLETSKTKIHERTSRSVPTPNVLLPSSTPDRGEGGNKHNPQS